MRNWIPFVESQDKCPVSSEAMNNLLKFSKILLHNERKFDIYENSADGAVLLCTSIWWIGFGSRKAIKTFFFWIYANQAAKINAHFKIISSSSHTHPCQAI